MRLPLLVSVPHAGLAIPGDLADECVLGAEEVLADSDEQAAEIFSLEADVLQFVTTDVPRAVIDMNRAPDDLGRDGVVKTHTALDVPIWREPLSDDRVTELIRTFHEPYHTKLSFPMPGIRAGVDCHTMLEFGPPSGPTPQVPRPQVCLSDGEGQTMPAEMVEALVAAFENEFDEVAVNEPFKGGYICRRHALEMPWVQVEINRGDFLTVEQKRIRVKRALHRWWYSLG